MESRINHAKTLLEDILDGWYSWQKIAFMVMAETGIDGNIACYAVIVAACPRRKFALLG